MKIKIADKQPNKQVILIVNEANPDEVIGWINAHHVGNAELIVKAVNYYQECKDGFVGPS